MIGVSILLSEEALVVYDTSRVLDQAFPVQSSQNVLLLPELVGCRQSWPQARKRHCNPLSTVLGVHDLDRAPLKP